jgi:hypothetical protein
MKILLSAALLRNPRVLALDEPVSGLDVSTALVLRAIVRALGAVALFLGYAGGRGLTPARYDGEQESTALQVLNLN